ncbi:peptide chain release factor 2 [Candidatus Saccharibacteria bacterium]|nr:peptide chain release factor 2 [Candidatus Saccharibacteria bacterium]
MDIEKQARELLMAVRRAQQQIDIEQLEAALASLRAETAAPDLWSNQARAQKLTKQESDLAVRIHAWRSLEKGVHDIQELASLSDDSLKSELEKQLAGYQKQYDQLKTELLYSGEYDKHDAIVSIHAGAGGTDAQDWAQMLLRMYLRWAEKAGLSTDMIDESTGEEAGIKSATFEVSGSFAYGKLQAEQGVHRLVRLSPFNSDSLRQTSFAKVEVVPKIDSPDDVQIDDKDLKIDVYRSGGKGGQSVNTTDSAVRVTHTPTGIVVAIQNERSQLQNKETAMTILRSKLAQLQQEQHLENVAELKGPNEQAAWGNQIRNYVLHPYKQVKDLRTRHESTDPDGVLDGNLDDFITAYLEQNTK